MSKYNNFSALPFYGFADGQDEAWDCNKWYAWGQIYPFKVTGRLVPFFFHIGRETSLTHADVYKLCEKSGTEINLSDFEKVKLGVESQLLEVTSRDPNPSNKLNDYLGSYEKKGDFIVWSSNQNIKWKRDVIGEYTGYSLYDYSSSLPVSVTGDNNKVLFFRQDNYSEPIGNKIVGLADRTNGSFLQENGGIREVGSTSQSWLEYFKQNGLTEDFAMGEVIFKTGIKMFDDGYYFIKFTTSKNEAYYSEIFKVEKNMGENHLALEWRNYPGDAGEMDLIPYKNSYVNKIFVESTLGMPSYEYEEEGEKRSGYFYPTRQLSYKKYKFTFIAPEYLCDVLRLVPMSDEIKITDSMGIILEPTDFNIDFNWLDGGHYAKVDCEFTTDTVVKKIGGMQLYKGRDFNLDWGKDFNSLSLNK